MSGHFTPVPCSLCVFRGACGGLGGQLKFSGCWDRCRSGGPDGVSTCHLDWVCPCKASFPARLQDVGGTLDPPTISPLPPIRAILPFYVPRVLHGSNRRQAFSFPAVAISTYDLFHQTSAYEPRFASMAELRAAFQLAPETRVILVSMNDDSLLERFWEHRRAAARAIQVLGGIDAITAPTSPTLEMDHSPTRHGTLGGRSLLLKNLSPTACP